MTAQAAPTHVPLYTSERRLNGPDFRKTPLEPTPKRLADAVEFFLAERERGCGDVLL
jgi:hypothetical protein